MQPSSAVSALTGLVGITGFGLAIAICIWLQPKPAIGTVLLITLTAIPMWWQEWRRHRSSATNGNQEATSLSIRRSWYFRGILSVAPIWLLTLGLFFSCIPDITVGFWGVAALSWPVLLLLLVLNLWNFDSTVSPTETIGRWWTCRQEPFPWHFLRDQLVKAFFLPLMLAFSYTWLIQVYWNLSEAKSFRWYSLSLALLYLIDTVFASIGYISASHKTDSHIRSSNPYWLGWISALMCYPPFFEWLKAAGFNYRDGFEWHHWLGISGLMASCWGVAILVLTAIYTWATIVFGIRFSNLTNRGIITHGPYRFTKHPAYLAKNVSWWLISVPFISNASSLQALLHCLILLCVNCIYWVRAKTEERHLMADPTYVAYARWIAEHGLWTKFRRKLSSLRFTALS